MFVIKWHWTDHLGERRYIWAAAKGSGPAHNKASEQTISWVPIQTQILPIMHKKTQEKKLKA